MRKAIVLSVAAVVLAVSGCVTQASKQTLADVAPYPQSEIGYKRHVIWLPPVNDEDLHKVELIPVQEIVTDCNIHAYMGQLDEKTLDGWGYTYYQLTNVQGPMSTLMACPGQQLTPALVPVRVDNNWVRYNSKLPIVVYAPTDFEVRYRIWSAPEAMLNAGIE